MFLSVLVSTVTEHGLIKPCLEWSLTGGKKSNGKFKAGHLQEKVFYELEAPPLMISVGKFRFECCYFDTCTFLSVNKLGKAKTD